MREFGHRLPTEIASTTPVVEMVSSMLRVASMSEISGAHVTGSSGPENGAVLRSSSARHFTMALACSNLSIHTFPASWPMLDRNALRSFERACLKAATSFVSVCSTSAGVLFCMMLSTTVTHTHRFAPRLPSSTTALQRHKKQQQAQGPVQIFPTFLGVVQERTPMHQGEGVGCPRFAASTITERVRSRLAQGLSSSSSPFEFVTRTRRSEPFSPS